MDIQTEARLRLVAIIKPLAIEKREALEQGKREFSQWKRPDFIWHYLLQAFSTWGNSRGWHGLINDPDNYNKVTFEALNQFSPSKRLAILERTLRDAKVRMPKKKAEYLARNFEMIVEMGGPSAAKEKLETTPGRQGKMEFLKTFVGVGSKYARDIMMDVYHPEFRDSIAVDTRVKNITQMLGLRFSTYQEYEEFYLEVARDAGLNGWELDRLMYANKDTIISQLQIDNFGNAQTSAEVCQNQLQSRLDNLENDMVAIQAKVDHLTTLVEQLISEDNQNP